MAFTPPALTMPSRGGLAETFLERAGTARDLSSLIGEALHVAAGGIFAVEQQEHPPITTPLVPWLRINFPAAVSKPFGVRHERLWAWFEALTPGVKPRARVEIWPRGGAKALALDTPIPTPTGWTTMADARPGDTVLDHRGRPTTITAVSPVEVRSAFRVVFDDGSSIIASGDHLWSVLDREARMSMPDGVDWATDTWDERDGKPRCAVDGCDGRTRKGTLCSAHAERKRRGMPMVAVKWRVRDAVGSPRAARVLTTEQLLAAGLRKGSERRWAIPVAGALGGPNMVLPVHPYVLGAWLGDGTTTHAAITCGEEDVAEMEANLRACGVNVRRIQRPSSYTLSLIGGTRVALRAAGVLGNKHIPQVYLRASWAQRLDLLRGLMDTDGSAVARRARCAEFCTTRPEMVGGARELAQSLGYRVTVMEGRATLRGKDCGPVWRLRIVGVGPEVFRLSRKAAAVQEATERGQRNTGRLRYIEAIERLPDRPVKCIVVDSPGHLFLAGDAWVPTHNSSTAELGTARVGMRHTRRFVLYVSATQGQANKHVQAVAHAFELLDMPRAVNRYGNSIGWRIDMLRVANGFNVLALGLDAAARGIKLGNDRPDLIILDDIDDRHDSEETIKKKISTITDSILPAGSSDCAVLFVQNRIHAGSIVSQMADDTAEFLLDREVYEEPAVRGLELESYIREEDGRRLYRITAGTPTWEGQDLATCEAQLNEWSRSAFLREAQHETEADEDGLWQRARDIDPFRVKPGAYPTLHRIAVAVDPNATSGGDEAGIVAAGVYRSPEGVLHGVVLEDATVDGGPRAWADAAVACYRRWDADVLVAEKNNGGDMVAITIETVRGAPPVRLVHASRGKLTRAEPVQKLAEDGRVHHAGVFVALERELCRWRPGDDSPNRLDALVWALTELMLKPSTPRSGYAGIQYSGT